MAVEIKQILTFEKPCIILPHYGEFGWFIIRYIRLVNYINSPKKIICCNKKEEVFFPTANKFYYDWKNPLNDQGKKGYRDYANKEKDKLIDKLLSEYPDYTILDPGTSVHPKVFNIDKNVKTKTGHLKSLYHIYNNTTFNLNYKKIGLKTDIVISARNRDRNKKREIPLKTWESIEELLIKKKLSFSIVGKEKTTHKLKNAKYCSWDFEDYNDASVELIKSSKLFISMDSGPGHLAKFLNKKMILLGKMGGAFHYFLRPSFKEKVVSIEDSAEKEILKKIDNYLK